jgi:hypothetical protein
MLVVSNNLLNKMPIADDTVIRINLAWIDSIGTATRLLDESKHQIYLDYPDGRKKPPRPKISLTEAIKLASHPSVKYFAVSNCEDVWKLKGIIAELPKTVDFVPKIETKQGVYNMGAMEEIGIKTFMLDKEDLYTDVNCDSCAYNELVARAMLHKGVMSLQGVVFI